MIVPLICQPFGINLWFLGHSFRPHGSAVVAAHHSQPWGKKPYGTYMCFFMRVSLVHWSSHDTIPWYEDIQDSWTPHFNGISLPSWHPAGPRLIWDHCCHAWRKPLREPSEGIENWGLDTNLKRTIDNSCGVFTVFALIVNGLVVPSTNEYPIDHPRPIFDI